jgi:membrane associated rhomboid family serine protease
VAPDPAFDAIVAHLRHQDPAVRPSSPRRALIAIALWSMVPFLIVIGGWTGFFIAVTGSAFGAYLVRPFRRTAGEADDQP